MLAQWCVYPTIGPVKIAVILPTHNDCRSMSTEVTNLLSEVPGWLSPTFLKRKTINEIRTDSTTILFVSNTDRLKGHTLNLVFRSSRINVSNNADAEYYTFLSALTGKPMQDFDDE
jgi:hypothetical protein